VNREECSSSRSWEIAAHHTSIEMKARRAAPLPQPGLAVVQRKLVTAEDASATSRLSLSSFIGGK
jgi:hypothetical protein